MKSALSILVTLIILIGCGTDHDSGETAKEEKDMKQDTMEYGAMKTYWLVFLLKGPNSNQDSAVAAVIQAKHIANIERLAKEKKIIMAGPMGDQTDLRGIFIMNCKDSLEAVSHIKTDTAIITGRLRFEIHPWWTAQGKYVFD